VRLPLVTSWRGGATLVIVLGPGSWRGRAIPTRRLFAIFGSSSPRRAAGDAAQPDVAPGRIGILISRRSPSLLRLSRRQRRGSAWIGWSLIRYVDDTRVPLNEPLPVLAAGLAAASPIGDRGCERRLLETAIFAGPARGGALPANTASHPPEIR